MTIQILNLTQYDSHKYFQIDCLTHYADLGDTYKNLIPIVKKEIKKLGFLPQKESVGHRLITHLQNKPKKLSKEKWDGHTYQQKFLFNCPIHSEYKVELELTGGD